MKRHELKSIPIFPDYEIKEVEPSMYCIKSGIHLHKNLPDYVKIYLYPIENHYIAKDSVEKSKIIKAHLRECFRISKYIDIDNFECDSFPIVALLDKKEDSFFDELCYNYT